ncbi:MAG: hypothetical protein WBL50_11610 [Candidatus Acidiferrum sp.]
MSIAVCHNRIAHNRVTVLFNSFTKHFAITAIFTTSIFVSPESLTGGSAKQTAEYQIANGEGVAVNERSVCVTVGGTDAHVVCLAPGTLLEQWSQSIGVHGALGLALAPINDESRLYVLTDSDLTAFGGSDGSILWTNRGGQEAHSTFTPSDYGLLLQNNHYYLELRDKATGEVRSVWPQINGIHE